MNNKVYTKEEMAQRIKHLEDIGVEHKTAVAIATFRGRNGVTFAIPTK